MSDDVRVQEDEMSDSEDQMHSRAWNWSLGGANSWIWGAVFILLGGMLLLQTLFPDLPVIIDAGNWWAVIILVIGLNMIGRGWYVFRRSGRVWGPLFWGIIISGFALTQFQIFSLDDYVWPVLLILGGLLLLFGSKRA